MGKTATTTARIDGSTSTGTALLEGSELLFRGAARVRIPLGRAKRVEAAGGVLRIAWDGHEAELHLGAAAEVWAAAIKNPKGRIEKLGLAAGQRIAIVGDADPAFLSELASRGLAFHTSLHGDSYDRIFSFVASEGDLERIEALRPLLDPAGALWIVRPKGGKLVTEDQVREAGKRAGMVDIKVVGFSERDTAEKLVIPVARRPAALVKAAAKKRAPARSGKPEARATIVLPPDVSKALPPAARAALAAMAPSHQRAYLGYIDEAKKPETRARRIAATVAKLREIAAAGT
ncbi:MAG: YdeI/OmpD-associated family protein [Acidobacteriota bacterium]